VKFFLPVLIILGSFSARADIMADIDVAIAKVDLFFKPAMENTYITRIIQYNTFSHLDILTGIRVMHEKNIAIQNDYYENSKKIRELIGRAEGDYSGLLNNLSFIVNAREEMKYAIESYDQNLYFNNKLIEALPMKCDLNNTRVKYALSKLKPSQIGLNIPEFSTSTSASWSPLDTYTNLPMGNAQQIVGSAMLSYYAGPLLIIYDFLKFGFSDNSDYKTQVANKLNQLISKINAVLEKLDSKDDRERLVLKACSQFQGYLESPDFSQDFQKFNTSTNDKSKLVEMRSDFESIEELYKLLSVRIADFDSKVDEQLKRDQEEVSSIITIDFTIERIEAIFPQYKAKKLVPVLNMGKGTSLKEEIQRRKLRREALVHGDLIFNDYEVPFFPYRTQRSGLLEKN
jgi:hypothetical protein